MTNPTPVQANPQLTIQQLYMEYGELCAQLKIAQLRYMECEKKLFPMLGLTITQQPPVQ